MWLKLPDEYGDDPRHAGHGAALLGADVAGQLYAARHFTDGVVAERVFTGRLLLDDNADELLELLVDVGLWHRPGHACSDCGQPPEGQVVSHEYLQNNPTRAQAEDRRQKRAAAGQKGGRRSGQTRRAKSEHTSPDEATAKANGSARASHANEPRTRTRTRPPPSLKEGGGGGECAVCRGSGLVVPDGENLAQRCPNCTPAVAS